MKKLFTTFLIGLVLISCDKDEVSYSKQLLPLKEGNEWFYKVYEYDELIDTVHMRVANNEKINHEGVILDSYKFYSSPVRILNPEYGYIYSVDETNGLMQVGVFSIDESLIMPSLYFKYPVSEGANWEYKHLVFSMSNDETSIELKFNGTETMECLEVNHEFQYNNKNLQCIVFKDNFSPYDDEIWARLTYIVPGIGIVKTEHFINDVLYREMVLYNYKLK